MDKTIQISTVPFLKLPEHDTIWAFIEGCDGRLYTGVCGEITGGMSAYVTGYDPLSGQVDYLCEMASTLGIPQDNGQATHSKVHKSLLQDEDGTIYAATHCTGAPVNDWIWRAWNCYNHPEKFFSGAGFVAMKNNGEVLYSKIILDREGSRCMALASKHRLIYGLSYPKNHFFVYDLEILLIQLIQLVDKLFLLKIFLLLQHLNMHVVLLEQKHLLLLLQLVS